MTTSTSQAPVAVVTGSSRGLGRAIAHELAGEGWRLIVTARGWPDLKAVADGLTGAVPLAGNVTDPDHRAAIAAAVDDLGRLDLLVNNASDLGPSPLPSLAAYPLDALRDVIETNVIAPLALTQVLLPQLRRHDGVVVNVSSDASIEAYPGWGGYGSSKAGLDQLSAVLGAEEKLVRVYAVDPGDMRTEMHQRAFPGEDISDRPDPETVAPALRHLLAARPESGRYRLAAWDHAGAGEEVPR